jgi:hypothetical protein
MIEAMVTLLALSMAMALFYEMMLSSMRISAFSESRNDLTTIAQRATNAIHGEIIQARLVFEEDSLGDPYRDAIAGALPSGVAVLAGSRLPIIDEDTATIGPDPGPNSIANRTGNSMLVVRQLPPIAVPWNHDANGATPNVDCFIDRYRFQYYFLRANPAVDFGGLGHYLEVMQATSQVFADYFQINSITVNRAQVASGVRSAGNILMAWDPGRAFNAPAFYDIQSSGTLSANSSPSFNLAVESLLPDFAGGRISSRMRYSVAPSPTSTMQFRHAVPLYATASSGFPEGLEFQVVGRSGARKALTRLVLAAHREGAFSSEESSITSSARGF